MKRKSNFTKIFLVSALMGIFCLGIFFDEVMAQVKFPEKPIKLLVGYSAGGNVDLSARMLGSLVTEYLGQPTVVLNVPGASSTVAANQLDVADPDGYTLGVFPSQTYSFVPYFVKVKYDPMRSIEPISCWGALRFSICVLHSAPWNSLYQSILSLPGGAAANLSCPPKTLFFSTRVT